MKESSKPETPVKAMSAARCSGCGSQAFAIVKHEAELNAICVTCGKSSPLPVSSLCEAGWHKSVEKVILNPSPVDVIQSINEALPKREIRMSPEFVAAFERDRLSHDGSGFDQWAATLTAALWAAKMHREGVQDGRMKPSPETDERAVFAASEIGVCSLDALASWCPDFFERIAKWMRECRDKHTRPTWGTVARDVILELRGRGLDRTKAQLKPLIVQRMRAAVGTRVPEPTKWADVWKECGIDDLRESKHGPAKGTKYDGNLRSSPCRKSSVRQKR